MHHHPFLPHPRPPWFAGAARKRRFVLRLFAALFGAVALVFLVGLVALFLMTWELPHGRPRPLAHLSLRLWLVPLGFLCLAALLSGLAFRRYGSPVADVMSAADAVAAGNLSVRLNEDAPGELGQLAGSFNRMAAELQRAEQQRRNLTADVAHELRTPLHIIQGNLEGMLDGVYPASREQISATLEETRLLARLVSDLQTLSLAEAGQLALHRVRCLAGDLLADTAASFAGAAAEQGVELAVDAPAEAGSLALDVDPDRIDQVLSNLVANALRYTSAGGHITLRTRAIAGGAHAADGVRLIVQDDGAGIPAADLPYIFDRFWRGDRARTRGPGAGSGLGLAIARQLVQAHGGRISAQSQPGQGTTLTIDLPTAGQGLLLP